MRPAVALKTTASSNASNAKNTNMTTKKRRVAALHGRGGSSNSFSNFLQKLVSETRETLEWTFLDGPIDEGKMHNFTGGENGKARFNTHAKHIEKRKICVREVSKRSFVRSNTKSSLYLNNKYSKNFISGTRRSSNLNCRHPIFVWNSAFHSSD